MSLAQLTVLILLLIIGCLIYLINTQNRDRDEGSQKGELADGC